jgi:poly(3-hydroxybutyrate) depolymerase
MAAEPLSRSCRATALAARLGRAGRLGAAVLSGDGDSARKHQEFYDEYRSVMDLPAEFYLQTVDTVFVKHALPKGEMTHRGAPVDLAAIRRVGLLTVEGENDDISGLGQTFAAQELCHGIPRSMKAHYQHKVGHFGVFNGSRFRNEIVPRIQEFHRSLRLQAEP